MLVQFTVGNYRSIKAEQTLSLVAGHDKSLSENLIKVANFKHSLLRQVAIYGANAAGKSNLLRAVEALRVMVEESARLQEGQALPWIQPHRLDAATEQQPTTFALVFLLDGVRYQYEVATTAQRVFHEELTAWPQGRPQTWFVRTFNRTQGKEQWKFGTHFKGNQSQQHLWQTSTRSNALFLSTAVQLNNEQLKPIFRWMTQQLIVIVPGKTDFNPALSFEQLHSRHGHDRLLAILNGADIGIERLYLKDVENDLNPSLMLLPLFKGHEILKVHKLMSIHKRTDHSEVEFDFDDESDGTRALFRFAGGWLKALEVGATLLVDELDRSLHPLLAQMLVKLFRSENNPSNAQLIFTTHDTTLLDAELLRRDQIWFAEKSQEGATQLYSLLEFSPRKQEALERGYLLGRYGAIPFVTEPRWQHG